MPRTKRSGALLAALTCGALLAAPAGASAAEAIYGLTDDNRIVRFSSDSPGNVVSTVAVQGLEAGETLVGLDVRLANDHLYAVGTSNRIYQVNPVTGATRRAFDPLDPGLSGAAFGLDFNPVTDTLRIVSDGEQNLRVPFDGGNAGRSIAETQLAYAAGDAGAGSNPSVTAAAYTNNVPGATETTLYDIDTARDALVRQNPPNDGTLTTVGALGLDAEANAGFDIAPAGNTAYAVLRPAGAERAQLYRIDLASGRATPVSDRAALGTTSPIRGIAVAGTVPDDRTRPEMSIAFSSTILEENTNPLKPSISCDEPCTITASARVEGVSGGTGTAVLDAPGRTTVEIPLTITAQRRIARRGTELIRLSVSAVDAAGNVTEQNGRLSRTQTIGARLNG